MTEQGGNSKDNAKKEKKKRMEKAHKRNEAREKKEYQNVSDAFLN